MGLLLPRLLFGLILSTLSFAAHSSSPRPHIIFILADDLVSMILILINRLDMRVYQVFCSYKLLFNLFQFSSTVYRGYAFQTINRRENKTEMS